MAELALENNFRRQLSSAHNQDSSSYSDSADGEDSSAGSEAEVARDFRRLINIAKRERGKSETDKLGEIAKKEFDAAAKLVKEAARRWAIREISWAFGATIIGLIVTYLIMTIQYIFGNWLRKAPWLALNIVEQLIWGCATFLVVISLIINFIIYLINLAVLLGPIAAAIQFGPELFGLIKDFLF